MTLKRLSSLICMFKRALELYSILLLAFLSLFLNLPSDAVAGWVKTYNGPGNGDDYAQAIAVDKSGNVYVTGASKGSTSNKDIVTIKYGSKGNQMWAQRYNGPGNNIDYANAITVDSGGNVYVTGAASGTKGDGESSRDFATIKYNTSGKQLTIGLGYVPIGFKLRSWETPDGNGLST